MQREVLRAGKAAWLILSGIVMLAMLAIIAVPPGLLYAAIPECDWQRLYGRPCFMCGMTHAFVALARGDPAAARGYHPWSPLLLGLVVVNQLGAVSAGARALMRRRQARYAGLRPGATREGEDVTCRLPR
jgi:hypothetical protein